MIRSLSQRLRLRLRLWALAHLVLAALAVVSLGANCGGPQRVAHVAIVGVGAAVESLHAEHRRVYREATDGVYAGLAADGGTREDYARITAPMDREFEARSAALQDLDAAIYGAAALNDAAREGASMAAVREAARHILTLITRALDRLEAGGVLPPVPIPPSVRSIVTTLTTLAGGSDAGR